MCAIWISTFRLLQGLQKRKTLHVLLCDDFWFRRKLTVRSMCGTKLVTASLQNYKQHNNLNARETTVMCNKTDWVLSNSSFDL